MNLKAGTCNFKSVSALLFQPALFNLDELSHARAEHQSLCGASCPAAARRSGFRDIKGAKAVGHAPQAPAFVIA